MLRALWRRFPAPGRPDDRSTPGRCRSPALLALTRSRDSQPWPAAVTL